VFYAPEPDSNLTDVSRQLDTAARSCYHFAMQTILAAAFALAALTGWGEPTAENRIEGDAAYHNRIAEAAFNQGVDLADVRDGCALMACGDLGRRVWVWVGGPWVGPLTVVDCSRRDHYQMNVERGRVIDLSAELWADLGLPLAPVGVVVRFEDRARGWR